MGLFENFPYSNFHELNFGWFLEKFRELINQWDNFQIDINNDIINAVNQWLIDHPEATTTVQDHSLSIDKMIIGTLGYVTPEMYGAVGDGATDDTAAFQAALANPNTILLCKNIYNVTGAVEVNSNTTIIGGNFKVDLDVFHADGKNNITIRNAVFQGQYVGGNATTGDILLFENCDTVTVENCTFKNIGSMYCVRFEKSINCITIGNYIDTYAFSGISHQNGCSNVLVFFNRVYYGTATNMLNRYPIALSGGGVWTSDLKQPENLICCFNHVMDVFGLWEGIDSHAGNNIYISNNLVEGTASGIVVTRWTTVGSGVPAPTLENVYIKDNVLIGGNQVVVLTASQNGIDVSNASTSFAKNVHITGNTIKNYGMTVGSGATYGTGISIVYTSDFEIRDNIIDTVGYVGIHVKGLCDSAVISGNRIDNLSKSETYCIFIVLTPTHLIDIRNNLLGKYSDVYTPFRLYRGSATNANTGYIHFHDNELGSYSSSLFSHIESTLFDRYPYSPVNQFYAGKIGDIITLLNPTSGNPWGWICTVDGSTASPQVKSTWSAIGTVA